MEKKRRETPEKEKKEWGKTSKKCGNACENMNAWKEVWKLGPEGSVETRTGRKCGSNRIGLRRLKRTEKAEKIERQKRTVKEREAAKK